MSSKLKESKPTKLPGRKNPAPGPGEPPRPARDLPVAQDVRERERRMERPSPYTNGFASSADRQPVFSLVSPNSDLKPQNHHIAQAMYQATQAVMRLLDRDIVVLSVHCEGAKPVIWIQPPHDKLHGGVMIRRRGPRGIELVKVCLVEQCQVQWRVVGH